MKINSVFLDYYKVRLLRVYKLPVTILAPPILGYLQARLEGFEGDHGLSSVDRFTHSAIIYRALFVQGSVGIIARIGEKQWRDSGVVGEALLKEKENIFNNVKEKNTGGTQKRQKF